MREVSIPSRSRVAPAQAGRLVALAFLSLLGGWLPAEIRNASMAKRRKATTPAESSPAALSIDEFIAAERAKLISQYYRAPWQFPSRSSEPEWIPGLNARLQRIAGLEIERRKLALLERQSAGPPHNARYGKKRGPKKTGMSSKTLKRYEKWKAMSDTASHDDIAYQSGVKRSTVTMGLKRLRELHQAESLKKR
jgi:hypothetical protein